MRSPKYLEIGSIGEWDIGWFYIDCVTRGKRFAERSPKNVFQWHFSSVNRLNSVTVYPIYVIPLPMSPCSFVNFYRSRANQSGILHSMHRVKIHLHTSIKFSSTPAAACINVLNTLMYEIWWRMKLSIIVFTDVLSSHCYQISNCQSNEKTGIEYE